MNSLKRKEILAMLPPAPPETEEWIYKDAVKGTYLIYDRDKNEGVCTRCDRRFRLYDNFIAPKHNRAGECPLCGAPAILKASGRGRGNLEECFRVLIFTIKEKTVYGALHEVTADFSAYGKPFLKNHLTAAYVFNKNRQEYYHTDWIGEVFNQVKEVRLPHTNPGMYGTEGKFERTEVICDKNIFEGTDLKYLLVPEFTKRLDVYRLIRYMALGLKYQSIELLVKSGFHELVLQKLGEELGGGAVNWRGKNLPKILKLPIGAIRKLPRDKVTFSTLATYQKLTPKERLLSWEIIKHITHVSESTKQKVSKIINYMKWLERTGGEIFERDWLDYIEDCRALGIDTRKKKVLFPENFPEAHAELAARRKIEEDKEKDLKIMQTAKDYAFELKSDSFLLLMPESQEDLNKESSAQHHCVKTYGSKVANEFTHIYFIRKKEEPGKPFYTLEIGKNGKLVQCRGEKNCLMTDEVKEFVEIAVKEFGRMMKEKERKAV